jgi:hypothetical protein
LSDIYRVTSWGKAVGLGATGAQYVNVSAVGKTNSANAPYVVANELVCSQLGHILKLPVPPGFVIVNESGQPHFASLDFNLTGDTLPPIIPDRFVAAFREQIGSILAFDIFIANDDRHARNLAADYSTNPPRYILFDHSHALLGGNQNGIPKLDAASAALALGNHVLAGHIENDELFDSMLARIEQMPDYFIEETVSGAEDYGLDGATAERLRNFLGDRRSHVRQLILDNKGAFPGIKQWRL